MKPKENDWWICEIHSDQSETRKTIRVCRGVPNLFIAFFVWAISTTPSQLPTPSQLNAVVCSQVTERAWVTIDSKS